VSGGKSGGSRKSGLDMKSSKNNATFAVSLQAVATSGANLAGGTSGSALLPTHGRASGRGSGGASSRAMYSGGVPNAEVAMKQLTFEEKTDDQQLQAV
jgi:hypothetical protein